MLLLIINILGYKWMITNNIKTQNNGIITDAFAEEYNNVDNMFIMAINYTMPVVDVSFKTQGYSGKDLTIASLLNIDTNNPLSIIKYQIPVLAQGENKNASTAKNNITSNVDNGKQTSKPEEAPPDISANSNIKSLGKPIILLYHTHTMESFVATPKYKYIASYGYDRTDNLNLSVAKVGDYLTDYLEKNYGISVLHNKTIHDYNYDESYYNSSLTVKKMLENNPSIKVAIDLHRDGYGGIMKPGVDCIPALSSLPNQPYRNKYIMDINGERIAKLMFVIGARRTKDMNEDWKKNYEFAKQLSDKLNELYPGISLGVEVHTYSEYNQHFLDKAILIELGCNENTLEEALGTTKYLAKGLYEVLKEDKIIN
jgi:stage II sporulation protein P